MAARASSPLARAAPDRDAARDTDGGRGGERAARRPEPPRLARASTPGEEDAAPRPLADARRSLLFARTGIQPALLISQPGDAAEVEADRVAERIAAMPEPTRDGAGGRADGRLSRSPFVIHRAPGPAPQPVSENVADPATEAAVKEQLSGGTPMAADVAGFFARRFRANFGDVRVHTDARAANLATRLGARAFTYGRHVFFNAGQYNPDSEDGTKLIAHELAHTIQQQAVIQLKEASAAPPRVTERSAPKAQRGIVSRALNWIADKANYIPGFRLFTIVIGVNPINMASVERSGANILRALIEFIPGGGLIVDALNNHGIFEKGGKFIEDQFRSLGMVGAAFRDALMEFIDSLSWRDVFHLGDVWDRAKRIFTAPVDKLIDFGKGLVRGIATIVKDAILKPLGRYAAGIIPKFDLLAGVFGKNPVSGEGASPAEALIGGFMRLIGQEEVFANLQKSGALGKAWSWFKGVLSGALALVRSIPDRFVATLKSLTIFDIVTIVGAWVKFAKLFAGFVGDFASWAGGKVLDLLEIIFSVVAPSVVPYLKKAGGAFKTILRAPGRFISTLVAAGRQGFNQFKGNIVKHLTDGLFKWLLGAAEGAGIYFPKSFAPLELLKMGLSVLGLTWANVRTKLVAATNETVVKALETGLDLVKTLVTQGPAAAWEQLVKELSNLKAMVVDAAIDFVKGEVVRIAIEKLVSFLTPAGAFVQAVIAIYRTVTFIIDKLSEIGRLVAAFIDGIAALANGIIAAAANRVESVLASGLSLAISFLAKFAGLGNVPKKVMDIIKKIRTPVDKALDTVVNWVVAQAKRLGKMIMKGGKAAVAGMLEVDKENKVDPRVTAGKMFSKRVKPDADFSSAQAAASGILTELSAVGLKTLTFGEPDASGNRDVFAEASPRSKIGKLAGKSITVAVSAKISVQNRPVVQDQLLPQAPLLTGKDIVSDIGEPSLGGHPQNLLFTPLPAKRAKASGFSSGISQIAGVGQAPGVSARRGSQPAAGFVIEPQAGSPVLEVVTFNTKEPIKGSNISHAEHQFVEWFDRRSYAWRRKVVSIDISVDGRPICPQCNADLSGLRSRYPWIVIKF